MMETRYRIVFKGKRISGMDLNVIRRNIKKIFSIDDATADRILKSERVVLKKNLDKENARRFVLVLKKTGLLVTVEAMSPEKIQPAARSGIPSPSGGWKLPDTQKEMRSDPPGVQAPGASQEQKTLSVESIPFDFKGIGADYFRIWLVNTLLSILTFGIYTPWAKVRRKRYFYGSTRLYGSGFEFLADPLKILKGRAVVALAFIILSIVDNLLPIVTPMTSLIIIIVLPWVAIRSLAFNAYNTAFRNVRFGFRADYWESFKVFILWPIASVLTLGILSPLAYYKNRQFIVTHTRYGTSPFKFNATSKDYYHLFFTMMLPVLLAIVATGIAVFVFAPLALPVVLVFYLYGFAFVSVKTGNLLFNSCRLGPHRFAATMEIRPYTWLVLTNTIATAVTLGLFHPWASVRTAKYKLQHLMLMAKGDPDHFIADQDRQVSAIGEEMSDFMDFDFGL